MGSAAAEGGLHGAGARKCDSGLAVRWNRGVSGQRGVRSGGEGSVRGGGVRNSVVDAEFPVREDAGGT